MTATHLVEGIQLPAAGTWAIDPGHAEVTFVGRHLGLTKTRGRFTRVDAIVHIAEDPAESIIEVTIDMASVESGFGPRDDSLRSAHYFDVEEHPTATFRSTVIALDGTRGTIAGDLTVKGVARPVVLDVEYLGAVRDPWGNDRAAFTATSTINRHDWGMTANLTLDSGRLLVSKHVTLEIDLELVRQ